MTRPAEHPDLWADYRRDRSDAARNRLALAYLPLVHKVAAEVYRQRRLFLADHDDLVSAGVFGLLRGLAAYDSARGVKAVTYLAFRIRHAILDWLFAFRLRTPRRQQAGREKKVPLAAAPEPVAPDDLGVLLDVEEAETFLALVSPSQAQILRLHYAQGLPFYEIARRLRVREERVRTAHRAALATIRRLAS